MSSLRQKIVLEEGTNREHEPGPPTELPVKEVPKSLGWAPLQ